MHHLHNHRRFAYAQVVHTLAFACGSGCLVALLVWSARAQAFEPIEIKYLWQTQPELPIDWQIRTHVPRVDVTPSQLASGRASERIHVAQSVVRVPNSPSFDAGAMLRALMAGLQQGERQPIVRAAMVAAACELDDGQNAASLWHIAKDDLLIQPIVEQACINWHRSEPLEIWRSRLRNVSASTEQQLARALKGVAITGSQEDLAVLSSFVSDLAHTETLRLDAARAIGRLSTSSQLELAQRLRKDRSQLAETMAVSVLENSPPGEVSDFMVDVSEHGAPVAQRRAYDWMCRFDVNRARQRAPTFLKHVDAEVRRLAILQISAADTHETLGALVEALGDASPKLRNIARHELLSFASRSTPHLQSVEQILPQCLAGEDWQSVEQYIRLCVELNQAQYVERFLELLAHDRAEVCITAAWALRNLADGEETLAAMLEHVQHWTARLEGTDASGPIDERDLRRIAHLLEAFGQRRYEPAKQTVVKYVPKNGQRMGMITRMTGMWACGRLWENEPNKPLTDELVARIADKAVPVVEPESIRFAATVALGWIADPATRAALVKYDEPDPAPISFATAWALQRIDAK